MKNFKIFSQELSNMQYSILNYRCQAVHYIPMMYLFYNWKSVTFDFLHPFHLLPTPIYWQERLGTAWGQWNLETETVGAKDSLGTATGHLMLVADIANQSWPSFPLNPAIA